MAGCQPAISPPSLQLVSPEFYQTRTYTIPRLGKRPAVTVVEHYYTRKQTEHIDDSKIDAVTHAIDNALKEMRPR